MHFIVIYLTTLFTSLLISFKLYFSFKSDISSCDKDNFSNNEVKKAIKYITIKVVLFFIVSIILLFGFWYYLSAFCAVYYNSQIPLLNDNIASFLTSMIYPFLLDLIPVIFRIISLTNKMKCLYIFSKILIKIIGIL